MRNSQHPPNPTPEAGAGRAWLSGRGNLSNCGGDGGHLASLFYNDNEVSTSKVRVFYSIPPAPWRNHLKKSHIGLVFAILAVLAGAFWAYRRVAESGFVWAEFIGALTGVRWVWLAASLPPILLTYLVRALRWQVFLRPVAPQVDFSRIASATCIGFTAVVLFGRAGEAVRPYLIARDHKVPISTQVAAWLVERLLDTLMVMLLFGIALTQVGESGYSLEPGPKMRVALEAGSWLAGITALACLALFAGLRIFRGQVHTRITDALRFLPDPVLYRVRDFLVAFDEGMQSTRDTASMVAMAWHTAAVWLLLGGAYYCIFRAFPALDALRFSDVIVTLAFVSFASVVQIPGVGGGIQIATILVLTELYRLSIEPASVMALVLWLEGFVSIVPIGLILAFREGVQWRNMRRVGDDPQYQL
jgi:hypothetical protein